MGENAEGDGRGGTSNALIPLRLLATIAHSSSVVIPFPLGRSSSYTRGTVISNRHSFSSTGSFAEIILTDNSTSGRSNPRSISLKFARSLDMSVIVIWTAQQYRSCHVTSARRSIRIAWQILLAKKSFLALVLPPPHATTMHPRRCFAFQHHLHPSAGRRDSRKSWECDQLLLDPTVFSSSSADTTNARR